MKLGYSLSLSGAASKPRPSLKALTLSPAAATAGSPWSAAISGKTAGSTITAASSDGTSLSVSGTTISGTFAAGGSPTVTLTETLSNAGNSPRVSPATVTVAVDVLQALTLNSNSFPGSQATTRTINGRTAGSTFTGSLNNTTGVTAGPTFDNTAGTVTITFNGLGSGAAKSLTIVETKAGATGSPRSTTISLQS